jgi:hypothetical protein
MSTNDDDVASDFLSDVVSDFFSIEADARHSLHSDHASHRPLSEGYELVGLVGEGEFSRVSHQPLDLNRRPGGDGRVDFVVPFRVTIDVKTARKAGNLIEEEGKVTCDVYVLAEYSDDTRSAILVGWEKGSVLARAPLRDFGHGILNHYIPRDQLRPIPDLLKRMMRLV